jgi:hypothetical protein
MCSGRPLYKSNFKEQTFFQALRGGIFEVKLLYFQASKLEGPTCHETEVYFSTGAKKGKHIPCEARERATEPGIAIPGYIRCGGVGDECGVPVLMVYECGDENQIPRFARDDNPKTKTRTRFLASLVMTIQKQRAEKCGCKRDVSVSLRSAST